MRLIGLLALVLIASSSGYGQSIETWHKRLNQYEMLIGKGNKLIQFQFICKNLVTGRVRPVAALNRWYICWNHDHIAFSPNDRYAVWRDAGGCFIACSLDGRMKRYVWADSWNEHTDLVWLPDNHRFCIFTDEQEDPIHNRRWHHKIVLFDLHQPNRTRKYELPVALARMLDYNTANEALIARKFVQQMRLFAGDQAKRRSHFTRLPQYN